MAGKWSKAHLNGYLAGVFDGEGSITCHTHGLTHNPNPGWTMVRASVFMTDRGPLTLFAARFPGGSISSRHRNPAYKVAYTWCIRGKKAREVLEFVSRFCIVKSHQATLALRVIDLLFDQGSKDSWQGISPENIQERLAIARKVSELKKIPVDDALGHLNDLDG